MRSTVFTVVAAFWIGCGGSSDPLDAGRDDVDAGGAIDAGRDGGPMGDRDAGPEIVDAATSAYATLSVLCQEGPFAREDPAPEGCEPPAAQCPTAPSEGAVPLMHVATCSYGRDETGCEPVIGGMCPMRTGAFFDFNLINPNPGAPLTCWGRAHLFVEPNASGGVHIDYGGYPANSEGCAPLGIVEGEVEVENMCCEQIIDVHFPHGEFTFRMAVRVDWTAP
jgi:hypothetical protein